MTQTNSSFYESLQPLIEKVDSKTDKERAMIFALSSFFLVILLYLILIGPAIKQKASVEMALDQVTSTIEQKKREKKQLELLFEKGVNHAKLAKIDSLEKTLKQLDAQIEASISSLIPPKLMAEVLEEIFLKSGKLKLVSLENLPVVDLLKPGSKTNVASETTVSTRNELNTSQHEGLYKHAFVIELKGGYAATVDYFKALSALPLGFNWDELQYKVTKYPNASIKLEVHTLSMSEDWIGV